MNHQRTLIEELGDAQRARTALSEAVADMFAVYEAVLQAEPPTGGGSGATLRDAAAAAHAGLSCALEVVRLRQEHSFRSEEYAERCACEGNYRA